MCQINIIIKLSITKHRTYLCFLYELLSYCPTVLPLRQLVRSTINYFLVQLLTAYNLIQNQSQWFFCSRMDSLRASVEFFKNRLISLVRENAFDQCQWIRNCVNRAYAKQAELSFPHVSDSSLIQIPVHIARSQSRNVVEEGYHSQIYIYVSYFIIIYR